MWQALRDLVNSAKESLGIDVPTVPDGGTVSDAVTGVGDQASAAVTTATDAATGAAGTVADTLGGAGESVTAAGEEISSKLSDILGRLGG